MNKKELKKEIKWCKKVLKKGIYGFDELRYMWRLKALEEVLRSK